MIIEALLALALGSQDVEPDCGGNMLEITACFAEAADNSKQRMEAYYRAALHKLVEAEIDDNPGAGAAASTHLTYSQMLFEQHVNSECRATYERFAMGSIRNAEAQACRLQLFNARTRDLWSRWLTYPDSTPPDLPEPKPIVAE